jgi:glutamate--cysteine ligase
VPAPQVNLTTRDVRVVLDDCFRPSAGGRVGIEAEWFVVALDDPCRAVPIEQVSEVCARVSPRLNGSRLTFEPGGQVELSSAPGEGIDAAARILSDDTVVLRDALAAEGLGLVALGLDPQRPRRRVLDTARYRAMARYFDTEWPAGAAMMCGTASIQVNLDIGAACDVDARWDLAHAMGPTLAAAFANSPLEDGRPSGWRSTRLAVWLALDPTRTTPVASSLPPARAWEQYVLDARVMLVRRSDEDYEPVLTPLTFRAWMEGDDRWGWPTIDDLRYHLTTLFPPVRPRGWLELRMLDALPDPWWKVAAAVSTALLDDPEALAGAGNAVARARDMWREAARHAMQHPILARAARDCFAIALSALVRLDAEPSTVDLVAEYRDRYVARGRCPADDRLAEWTRDGNHWPAASDRPRERA